ncbi:uncharacterized protein LOC143839315 isoform X2 [Paroedura picta]
MGEDDYIQSLALLPDTLAELGAELEKVSLGEEDPWQLTSTASFINCTQAILESLEDNGFFPFLHNLSKIAREMKSVLVAASAWKVPEVVVQVEQTLRPMSGPVSRFAPKEAHETLLDMKDFLEAVGDNDWDGEYCLEHLSVLHGYLEELRPGSRLSCLKSLRGLLVGQGQHLERLANHPVTEQNLGRWNLFDQLKFIKGYLESVMDNEDFLAGLQEMLEELDHVQTINLHN